MNDFLREAWGLAAHEPKHDAPLVDQLRFAVQCAVLAPSSHNSQPWRFQLLDDGLLVMRDRCRALPVVDPYDRELTISCGAALFNIRVAIAHLGRRARIDVLPYSQDDDVLARVYVEAPGVNADSSLAALFGAIPARCTNRGKFADQAIPSELIGKLQAAASDEWATLSIATSEEHRGSVATLIAAADLMQLSDVRFRRELASWIHPKRSRDGLSLYGGDAKGIVDFVNPIASFVVRTFDVGDGVAARDKALATGSPLLACISTGTDDSTAWLAAGQALQRGLLTLTADGYDASYLNQPIEVTGFRDALAQMMSTEKFPQLLLRIGRGSLQSHSPRRLLEDVLS
jgi:hypothetical protein